MGVQLRVTLPDQPGALARVAQTLAALGADVLAVTVLESEGGRAVDDFRLQWPAGRDVAQITEALDGCAGVAVLGCRSSRWLRDGRPDLDLLGHVMAAPERGMETVVDMAPAAMDADWAELRSPVRRQPALYSTTAQPHDSSSAPSRDELAPTELPIRARSFRSGACAWAHLPVTPLRSVLVLGRDNGPPFLRAELVEAERVLTLSLTAVELALRSRARPAEPTDLTAHLSGRLVSP